MGGPINAYAAIDAHRAGTTINPMIQQNVQDPAEFDRYSQMAQFGEQFGPNAPWYKRALAPFMAGAGAGLLGLNEGSKMIPGMQSAMSYIDPSFQPDASTSQPSWGNIQAGMGGLIEGMAPGLFQ
jgi:hypothetical protein